MWGPCAIVDSGALRHNLAVVRKHAPRAKVMAIIKANAYGHGIVPTARALIGADAFGVARLTEALALREHGLGQRIVLLEGVFSSEELDAAAAHGLELVVHSFEQLALLKQWRGSRTLHVWLKIDTGMNRLGFRLEDFPPALQQLRECASVAASPRLMTHLASADERDSNFTNAQVTRFRSLAESLGLERSAANSAGLLAWSQSHMEWVRPGLMLYGVSPFPNSDGAAFDLRPAMTLSTRLIAVRHVRVGERVGYGGTWTAAVDCRVGIAAIGYGDGYPRQIGSGSPVLVRGAQCSIAGRVSMDMIAIDVSGL
ncbi:MAG TPA: alanine racemase, partial [Roseiflexaceae bacterium]|nr:alanine racemase [Roseiflexaceae bacterium]